MFNKSGYYEVGKDLEDGKYRLNGTGHYKICKEPSCNESLSEIIKSGAISSGTILTLKDSQYLIVSGSVNGNRQQIKE